MQGLVWLQRACRVIAPLVRCGPELMVLKCCHTVLGCRDGELTPQISSVCKLCLLLDRIPGSIGAWKHLVAVCLISERLLQMLQLTHVARRIGTGQWPDGLMEYVLGVSLTRGKAARPRA